MFAAGGKLVIRKAFYKLAELRKAYAEDHAAHGGMSPFVLHFRYATHGTKGEGNVHPHALADGAVGLVHNGVLYDYDFGHRDDSDTVTFCKTVLACRSVENLMSEELNLTLASLIEGGNKLVLMDGFSNVSIVNSTDGIWDGSRWYSNNSYLPSVPKEYAKWTPINVGRGVQRGMTFLPSMTEGQAKNAGILGGSRYADDDWRSIDTWDTDMDADDYAEERDATIEGELDRIDLGLADAERAGDEDTIEDLQAQRMAVEREQYQWADAELAMARDGY